MKRGVRGCALQESHFVVLYFCFLHNYSFLLLAVHVERRMPGSDSHTSSRKQRAAVDGPKTGILGRIWYICVCPPRAIAAIVLLTGR